MSRDPDHHVGPRPPASAGDRRGPASIAGIADTADGNGNVEAQENVASALISSDLETPAFVFDTAQLSKRGDELSRLLERVAGRTLYSVKACDCAPVVRQLSPYVDGYSVSSLFEARLVRDVDPREKHVHLVTPALSPRDAVVVPELCDRVTLNSSQQVRRHARPFAESGVDVGIRVNPKVPFASDTRFEAGHPASRLGIALSEVSRLLSDPPSGLAAVSGLHFHSNCESTDLRELLTVLDGLVATLGDSLGEFAWLNIGGGYLFHGTDALPEVSEIIDELRRRYGLEVVAEPGAAFVREAGFLVSTVLDVTETGATKIAVLDTTVNHWPEVFEYQFEPELSGDSADGGHEYQLTGASCLAGDVFGTYRFSAPLSPGSKVVFQNAGAYSIVKAHMFNGLNLPCIYAGSPARGFSLAGRFSYDDFRKARCLESL